MTYRSCWPLPCCTRRTMRALSISVICNWHSCGHPQPRGIERGEDGAVFQVVGRGQQGGYFRLTQNRREGEGPSGMGDILQHPRASEGDAVEEAQRTDGLHHGGPGHLLVLDEKELIGADLLRAQVLGEVRKCRAKSATQCRYARMVCSE